MPALAFRGTATLLARHARTGAAPAGPGYWRRRGLADAQLDRLLRLYDGRRSGGGATWRLLPVRSENWRTATPGRSALQSAKVLLQRRRLRPGRAVLRRPPVRAQG